MAHVILFHHAQGLTEGVRRFAEQIGAAGHNVSVPDLFDGATFATVDAGVAHAEQIGFDVIVERGVAAANELPPRMVYVGFSLGAMPAQKLAQTRPGALAAILYHSAAPMSAYSKSWPGDVALQVHLNRDDKWDDRDVAKELVNAATDAELFVYPGATHLFTDSSLDDYEPDAANLALERTLGLLSRWA